MSRPARAGVLLLAAIVAVGLLLALTAAVGDVRDSDGAICGSAWRSSLRQTIHGGERTAVQVSAAQDKCQVAGDRALHGVPWLLTMSGVATAAAVAMIVASRRAEA